MSEPTTWKAPEFGSMRIQNFTGEVPPRRYLVEGRLPRGKAILLSADGGVGKSFLALQLVNAIDSGSAEAFGGRIPPACKGLPCFAIFAEDDKDEVTMRLNTIRERESGPQGSSRVCCVPNAPSSMVLFSKDPYDGLVKPTEAFHWMTQELGHMALENEGIGLVVIDTLTALAPVESNNAETMQMVMTYFGQVAARFDTTVLITHHNKKGATGNNASASRGSTAIVNGVRGAYALFQLPKAEAEALLKQAGMELAGMEVVQLIPTKSNGPVFKSSVTYLREGDGYLLDISSVLGDAMTPADALVKVITEACAAGHPMGKAGANGVNARKSDKWPGSIASMGRDALAKLVNSLLEDGRLIMTGKPQVLGVPEA